MGQQKRIRILLDDGMQISLGTGIGKYSEHLVRALSANDGVEVDLFDFKPGGSNRMSSRLKYLKYVNSSAFREMAEEYDLVIFTNYAMPFQKLHTTTVVTVHDLAVFDCPQSLPILYHLYCRTMIENSVRKADRVVTVSRTMLDDIVIRYPFAKSKASYAWPGVCEHVKVPTADNPYDNLELGKNASYPFFLMVGTVEKRKNVQFVIEAFSRFRSMHPDFRLILAGRPGFGFEQIEKTAKKAGCKDSVVFANYVTDNDCANLYRDAKALVFPSIYEGFGLIQTECMAMSLPIVLSDIPTNREVSEGYGFFFDLGDRESLSRAMEAVLSERSGRLSRAIAILKNANWENVAASYLQALSDETIS